LERTAGIKCTVTVIQTASVGGDIRPFAKFIAERVRWSMELEEASAA
jgi:hypothetical protein